MKAYCKAYREATSISHRRPVTLIAIMLFALVTFVGSPQLAQAAETPSVTYQAHAANIGWMNWVSDGQTAGTEGRCLQIEAVNFKVSGIDGTVRYQTHLADIGWQGWKNAGMISGTTGQNRRVEAIRIEITGNATSEYDVLYRVHVPEMGWLDWTKNGAVAGSTNMALRIEALQVKIAPKGAQVSGTAALSKPSLSISAHSADIGWQQAVGEGSIAGTTGRSLQLEALKLNLNDFGGGSAISTRAHVSNVGWQGWVSSGKVAGTTGKSLAIEAIEVRLSGDVSRYYDVYYRVHVRNYGWLGWAKNGETAGSTGLALPMEAVQVQLVRKDSSFDRGGSATVRQSAAASSLTPSASSYDIRVNAFLNDSRWYNGASWGSSHKPLLSSWTSSGCAAYAGDFCKYVFGVDNPRSGAAFYNPSDIRAGDVIKVTGSQHWFVVIGRNGNSLYTAEGNWTAGKVVVSNGAYTVSGNTLYRNGSKFRTFSVGYHMQ